MTKITSLSLRLICFFIIGFAGVNGIAQERFHRMYSAPNSDQIEGCAIYDENKYVLAGHTRSFDPTVLHDIGVCMLDSVGNIIWSRQYDNNSQEFARSLTIMDDNIYLTGRANNSQMFFIKLDLDGNLLVRYRMSHENVLGGYEIYPSEGHLMIAAIVHDGEGADTRVDPILIKMDVSGNVVWAKRYKCEFPSSELIFDLIEAENGDFLISGTVSNIGAGFSDMFLLRVSHEGEFLWYKTYGNEGQDISYKIVETATNELLLVGRYRVGELVRIGLIKTTSDGEVIWANSYAHSDDTPFSTVVEASDGNYVVRASCSYGDLDEKAALIKVDTAGNILWSHTYAGKENFQGTQQFYETSDQGFIIPTTINDDGIRNYGILKTDSLGMVVCNESLIEFTKEPLEVFMSEFEMPDTSITFARSVGFESEEIVFTDSLLCCDSVVANFSYIWEDGVYTFTADPMIGATYTWIINGETLTGEEVMTALPAGAESEVCLYVSNYCNSDSTCIDITLQQIAINEATKTDFLVYPNPVNDVLTIESVGNNQTYQLALFSQAGLLIHESNQQFGTAKIDIAQLERGIYILRISKDNGDVLNKKIVKY